MNLDLARTYMDEARLDDAERLLRDLRRDHPNRADVAIEYAFCAIRQWRFDVARARFRDAERRFGERADISIGLAEALIGSGHVDDARVLLERTASRHPENPWTDVLAVKCALIAGDLAVALAQIERTLEECARDEIHTAIADLLYDRDLVAEADGVLARARERFPDSLAVLRTAARSSSRAGQWEDALSVWTRYHAAAPNSALAASGIADALTHRLEDGRRIVVVYGNCQAEFICRLLAHVPTLALRYAFVAISNVALPGLDLPPIPASVSRAALVFEQHDRQQHVPVREQMRAHLPLDATVVRFPALNLSCLWPFGWPDHRIAPEPGFPWGRYPWGDRIAIEVAELHLDPDKALRRYMEVSREKMPDVRALLERDLAVAEVRDAASDVKMRAYIEERVRTSHIFWTWGHTSGAIMAEVARQLVHASIDMLPNEREDVDEQLRVAARLFPGQGREQVPVHPIVIERLGLEHLDATTRYEWFGNRWTFEEYFMRYMALDRSWHDRRAQEHPSASVLLGHG